MEPHAWAYTLWLWYTLDLYTTCVYSHIHTHTVCGSILSTIHPSLALFLWANQQMALFVLPFTAAGGQKTRAQSADWKGKRNAPRCVRARVFFVCAQYSDADLLTVRQTGELCHAALTNGRQRNGAMSDITAGIGRELSAWNCSPLKRQTGWAANVTLIIIKNHFASFFFLYIPVCYLFAETLTFLEPRPAIPSEHRTHRSQQAAFVIVIVSRVLKFICSCFALESKGLTIDIALFIYFHLNLSIFQDYTVSIEKYIIYYMNIM